MIRKGREEILWGNGYALYLVLGTRSMCVSPCHNSLNCTLESCAFYGTLIKSQFKKRGNQRRLGVIEL